MTTLIFLSLNHTFQMIDDPRPAADLVEMIHQGLWHFPLASAEFDSTIPLHTSMVASAHDNLVIVTVNPFPIESGIPVPQILTRRQREVLDGLIHGLTTRQIAAKLHIAQRTVAWHVVQLKKRIGASTLAQSVARTAFLTRAIRK